MKKHKFIGLVTVLALLVPALYVVAASPLHVTQRFVNGTYLCVSNSQTLTQSASNSWYFSYQAGTNLLGGATNASGVAAPGPLVDASVSPNLNGDVNNNVAMQVILGYTNKLFLPPNMSSSMVATMWTNVLSKFTNATAQTNTVTITVYPVSSEEFNVADTAGKSFSFAVIQTNGIPTVLSTNLPTALLQGEARLRITVANGAQAGTGLGVIVNAINLVGSRP